MQVWANNSCWATVSYTKTFLWHVHRLWEDEGSRSWAEVTYKKSWWGWVPSGQQQMQWTGAVETGLELLRPISKYKLQKEEFFLVIDDKSWCHPKLSCCKWKWIWCVVFLQKRKSIFVLFFHWTDPWEVSMSFFNPLVSSAPVVQSINKVPGPVFLEEMLLFVSSGKKQGGPTDHLDALAFIVIARTRTSHDLVFPKEIIRTQRDFFFSQQDVWWRLSGQSFALFVASKDRGCSKAIFLQFVVGSSSV